jgi:adenylate cyclase
MVTSPTVLEAVAALKPKTVDQFSICVIDAYVEALDAYRRKDWEKALAGFEDCLAIVPSDAPSKLFLERIAQFRITAPFAEWNGVWSLMEK